MDRGWISRKRTTPEFQQGVEDFIRFALAHKKEGERFSCPCKNCGNLQKLSTENELRGHIFCNGFSKSYTQWIFHGERAVDSTIDTNDLDIDDLDDDDDDGEEADRLEEMLHDIEDDFKERPHIFDSLLKDSEKPLYPGCPNYTRLSAVLKLFNLKSIYGLSDKGFSDILETFKDMLPPDNELPKSTYQAKKILCPMGLEVEKIHACPNDCVLYRNEYKDLRQCPRCGASRYKVKDIDESGKDGPPAKVLWYLPIVPRLKRLFANAKDAKNLTWYADRELKDDGIIRHPADSPQWQQIDDEFKDFADERRNIRFGLCTDGVNPFGNMSSQHSTWPVMLVIYNLPPWLCMKRKYLMLSLLISGPKQPGNDIDVYLAPLIEDMKMLWDKGASMFDAYRQETFTLRAMIYCTINDFPAYGNLSGHTVKGYKACPICEDDVRAISLPKSKKIVYLGHRRFLPRNHPYRRLRKAFDGQPEHGSPPVPPTGKQVYERVKDFNCEFGKPYKAPSDQNCYKKKSIFWNLPYWEKLSVRHCIDVMHVEKNVFDSLIGTLLNIPGKTKDGKNSRDDMAEMGIREELKAVKKEKRYYLPPACYTLSKNEKKILCESLHGVKVPHGYSSNIRKLVSLSDSKLVGLKSHDCHTLMQDILPVAIRSILPKPVRVAIINLCLFFKAICSKELDPENLDALQAKVVITLCQLEMYFSPSFFDIMIHLVVHLVREVKLCGPVYLRYMYPFERSMGDLKGYVRNRSRPEASMIEGYLTEEVLAFCTEYLAEMEVVGLPRPRHDEERIRGKGTVGRRVLNISRELLDQAFLYILQQSAAVSPYWDRHMDILRANNPGMTEKRLRDLHNSSFISWFKQTVNLELARVPNEVDDDVRWLSFGPSANVISYEGYDINGYCFYTKRKDGCSTMQNRGVSIEASALHFSDAKDNRPKNAKKWYYGVIEDIFELDFTEFRVPVLRCSWMELGRGVNIDEMGYTLVNFDRLGHKDEPFIMASQAEQVFYMKDPAQKSWSIVIQGKRHGVGAVEVVSNAKEYDEMDGVHMPSVNHNTPPIISDLEGHYLRADHNEGLWIKDKTVDD